MVRTGITNLPLHNGKAPHWLFKRMVRLGREISKVIILEYGTKEYLKRISNPFFFQSFGCLLGFDWHSSGLTTTLTGALKEALNKENLGIFIAGGKGRTALKTKGDIEKAVDKMNLNEEKLKEASRLTAKVDNSLIQDNYSLYHHSFFIDERGNWAVVQQGMNSELRYARRYHWLSFETEDFINEPHSDKNFIISEKIKTQTLDLSSRKSSETRKVSLELSKENPKKTVKIMYKIFERQKTLDEFFKGKVETLNMPKNHFIKGMKKRDLDMIKKVLRKSYEIQPKSYEELIKIEGFGPKTLRALSLTAQIIYGTEVSWRDPAKFSFAHGGKDGIPYPVNKKLMDKNTEFLKTAVKEAKLGKREKLVLTKKLNRLL